MQMKRRRDEIAARFAEPAGPNGVSLSKQSSSCFNCGNHQGGSLFDSIGILNALPCEPQVSSDFLESTALSLACAEGPISTLESLSITNLFEFADPCRHFEFNVISSLSSVCWEDISRNLQITAELAGGHALPAVSLHASTSFTVLPGVDRLRITISPAWWSHATSFTIVGLYYAGQLVNTPLLPAIVQLVSVNHALCNASRLWVSSKAGDLAGVVSAIKDGCSTEESDVKVCIMI